MLRRNSAALVALISILVLLPSSCALVRQTLETGGERKLKPVPPPPPPASTHVLIFALDGAAPKQLMEAVHSGHAPHIADLLGKDQGDGVFQHAYAAPHALSVLPSSTIADWASIFTGSTPAKDGVPGDEWFDRETMKFYAPVPVSVPETADNAKVVTDDLVGRQLKVPTLYHDLQPRSSFVSLLSIHRGATIYTTVSPGSFPDLFEHLIKGELKGNDDEKSLSAALDRDSIDKLLDAIKEHGIPDLQVVYLPGIDIFTHSASDRLAGQLRYLEHVTDGCVGRVLDEYRRQGVLDNTYVLFISDHAHIPTQADKRNQLGTDDEHSPFQAVHKAGFRVRRASLIIPEADTDYQAVLAYQGFMAYIYLADRSTCPNEDDRCDWKQPPRLEEDVIPVLKTLYRSNLTGRPVAKLKGTIDLIFARPAMPMGQNALPFMIFDGHDLVPVGEYLRAHPRPDLVDLEQRMNWLGTGPYGYRAGDIVLLPHACMNLPIEDRFYFAGMTHYTWHGSACEQDSHIPFILAKPNESGREMRNIMSDFGGDSPSERELTPLVRSLFPQTSREQTAQAASPKDAR
ncbi:MAG TPA: alkaline phosphatase family protein [Candidatus Binataceae bacterium]|nr:alkaline phosphatase family protein [Candidatus Binataceae bacterium]